MGGVKCDASYNYLDLKSTFDTLSSGKKVKLPCPGKTTKDEIAKLLTTSYSTEIEKKLLRYLHSYSLSTSAKTEITKYITKQKKAPPVVLTSAAKPPGYKLLDIKLVLTDDATPKTSSLKITLPELRKEIQTSPTFIHNFITSLKELAMFKIGFYTDRLGEIARQRHALERKMQKLEDMKISTADMKDVYPNYVNLVTYTITLDDLIRLIGERKITISGTKAALLDVIDNKIHGLASIIGRDQIKNMVASQLYAFSKGYTIFTKAFQNIRIYGSAGSGKTKLANVLAYVFSRVGILMRNQVYITSRVDFVGQFIGQTAPRTVSILMESLEAVLFIDEAQQLVPTTTALEGGNRDFGGEALGEIVNFLERYIGMNVVIVAGYQNLMKKHFMTYNEGMPRRFPYLYILNPYTTEELTDILITHFKEKIPRGTDVGTLGTLDYQGPKVHDFLYTVITALGTNKKSIESQAGDMLNLASALGRAVSSSYHKKWGSDYETNMEILLEGVNDFLATKEMTIELVASCQS